MGVGRASVRPKPLREGDMAAPVKVKRDGPRGWHWIAAEHYDPAVHVLADAPEPDPVAKPAPKLRGKKRTGE